MHSYKTQENVVKHGLIPFYRNGWDRLPSMIHLIWTDVSKVIYENKALEQKNKKLKHSVELRILKLF